MRLTTTTELQFQPQNFKTNVVVYICLNYDLQVDHNSWHSSYITFYLHITVEGEIFFFGGGGGQDVCVSNKKTCNTAFLSRADNCLSLFIAFTNIQKQTEFSKISWKSGQFYRQLCL